MKQADKEWFQNPNPGLISMGTLFKLTKLRKIHSQLEKCGQFKHVKGLYDLAYLHLVTVPFFSLTFFILAKCESCEFGKMACNEV